MRVAADVPRVLTVRELLDATAEATLNPVKTKEALTTGNYRLDSISGGFRPGFVWVVAADTSYGKSSFVIMVLDENIRKGRRCLIVSSEDTEELYGARLMVRRARVSAKDYRDKRLSAEDAVKVKETQAKGEPVPAFIYAGGWKLEDLCVHVDRVIKEAKIEWVCWDYLGEFRTKKRYQDERIRMREMAGMMRLVIKRNKISGAILSQVTIDENTSIPTKHNIRDCRDVANAAEVIVIGFETKKETDVGGKMMPIGTKCLLVDKCKDGPKGAKIVMPWDNRSACFDVELDPEAARYQKVVGNQFDDFGDDWRNQ